MMLFDKIITLSLNPAADITCYLNTLNPDQDNAVTSELYDAAGKAVDVSRVLQSYGLKNTAIIVAGRENSVRYFERLQDEHINTRVIYTSGRIRENMSLVLPDGQTTRLIRQGPKLRHHAINELEKVLSEEIVPKTLVVVAGANPQGVTDEIFCEICAFITQSGGTIALDSSAATLENIEKIKPWVLKPNYEEFCNIIGDKPTDLKEIKRHAKRLSDLGVRHVMVSLGEEGLFYTNGEQCIKADVPVLSDIKSTVGAGDATLAGFIIANDYQYDNMRAVQFAAAFGTASCLVEGTNPPRRISVAMVNNQVKVYEV